MMVELDGVSKLYPGSRPSLRGTKLEIQGPALWVQNALQAIRPTSSISPPVLALSDCTLSVAPGEIFGILGPNGSGKTTLIKILAGLIRPTAGTGQVDGVPLVRTRDIRRRVAYVSTTGWMGLEWALTAEENIRFFAMLTGMSTRLAGERTNEALRALDLLDDRNKLVSALSNGMRQRVIMARTLLWHTPVVLLDEPLVGLDIHHREALLQLLDDRLRRRGQTILLSDHDAGAVGSVADRLVLLSHGRVAGLGTAAELLDRLQGRRIVDLLTSEGGESFEKPPASVWRIERRPRPGPLGRLSWRVILDGGQDAALMDTVAWLERAGVTIFELTERAPSLQDVMDLDAGASDGRVSA